MRLTRTSGFTLIELIVVLAIIGLLLSIAAPRFSVGVDRSREAVLRQNLKAIRSALDQYHADTGKYADDLQALVSARYLREVPLDPIVDSRAEWTIVSPPVDSQSTGVYDVRSSAQGKAGDGSAYADW
ncbi:MAG: type II secretion system protein [Burkholderiales bacterium]